MLERVCIILSVLSILFKRIYAITGIIILNVKNWIISVKVTDFIPPKEEYKLIITPADKTP